MNQKTRQTYLLLLVIAIILTGISIVEAEISSYACVNAEVQEISPSSIGIDEEFTLGINLESCGTKTPEDITFEIISIPPDIIVTENLVTKVSKLTYSTSERYLIYHMRTTPDAKPGPHLIKMKLTYANKPVDTEKYYEVEIRVIGEDAEPRISSVKTNPGYIYEGEQLT